MSSIRTEKHRLTTLQRQIMKWMKMEGGGVLRVDHLFTTMMRNHSSPGAEPALLAERMCEAVDNLCRMDYAELRIESKVKKGKPISIYDFGSLSELLSENENSFLWKSGECPVVALTDAGTRYLD